MINFLFKFTFFHKNIPLPCGHTTGSNFFKVKKCGRK